ncbi:MAG: proton-conducting transporter membrane subunit [Deltaproteobacteria bacterium]|nr:proton-conducting transporter membrane subunit [Deltaproteobacteria bacterium]
MSLLLMALGVMMIGGLLALAAGRKSPASSYVGMGSLVIGSVIGLVPALQTLVQGETRTLRLAWEMPFGSFFLLLDPLSAFFLIPIFLLSGLAAIYGRGYLRGYREKKWLGWTWFAFNWLTASMAFVCLAHNAVLFLISWEVMTLSSFFLVAFEYEKSEVRKAAWMYMVASSLGTAFLLPMFLTFGSAAGSLDFNGFSRSLSSGAANACFVLALVGFGTKAGIMPFHVWLPVAHPAAPSPVSALMSGVMIKTGIYGIVRTLTFLGLPPLWWGHLVLAIGVASGVLGVLFALAQHDLKRLLAYSSVENIGIVLIGFGVGMIGWSSEMPVVAALGFAGGLLHLVNHALFKGLLFLGAGSVLDAVRHLEMDRLGGLLKKMPATGLTFLVGAVAISGLPPLNGFVGEFVIYMASFRGALTMDPYAALALIGAVAGLALIGGLAAACFTKAFGIVFLGEPRSEAAQEAREASLSMTVPMMILAAACIAVGLLGAAVMEGLSPVIGVILGRPPVGEIQRTADVLWQVTAGSLVFILFILAIAVLRFRLLAGRSVAHSATWDCGYAAPTARMQYTASSFSQPIIDLFRFTLRTKEQMTINDPYFPATAGSHFESDTPDIGRERIYDPLFAAVAGFFRRLRVLQEGRIHIYVLYIVGTLLALLFWNMRTPK